MFRRFAGKIPEGALALFKCHPLELTTLLEVAWKSRAHDAGKSLGHPGHRSDIPPIPGFWLNQLSNAASIEPPIDEIKGSNGILLHIGTNLENAINPSTDPTKRRTVLWDHLIYAYMIENTRIYEIFRRVVYEYLYGEKLGIPLPEAQHWLRNTEELFYRDPPSFFITSITSHIRPDMRASRRNAYQRMFGMDLNHGTDDGQPYPYVKADAFNKEFMPIFEEFLREAWVAISNRHNSSGPNPTDSGKIRNLIDNIQNMLLTRRQSGNLSREELVAIATMSWFHLTVSFNSPIIETLRAEAASPEQRLFKVAQRVGLPAHGLSKSFFDIADPISRVLIHIEASGSGIVPFIVVTSTPGTPLNELQEDLNTLITHWSLITGRDVKAGKVSTT